MRTLYFSWSAAFRPFLTRNLKYFRYWIIICPICTVGQVLWCRSLACVKGFFYPQLWYLMQCCYLCWHCHLQLCCPGRGPVLSCWVSKACWEQSPRHDETCLQNMLRLVSKTWWDLSLVHAEIYLQGMLWPISETGWGQCLRNADTCLHEYILGGWGKNKEFWQYVLLNLFLFGKFGLRNLFNC